MNSEVASQLKPNFPELKWSDLFKPTIESDSIPLNKRGSGVKRLILLSFFRAEAARRRTELNSSSVIYAIEEPETSQHPNWQISLVKSLIELSDNEDTQVILTTHSPELAGLIPCESLRYIIKNQESLVIKNCESDYESIFDIADTLGVLPKVDSIKLILIVEGYTDIHFMNNCLKHYGLDLENDRRVLTIFAGGTTLKKYIEYQYLKKLKCPEVHIYDNDVEDYKEIVATINQRTDGSLGLLTKCLNIESYYHPDIIKNVYNPYCDDFFIKEAGWQTNWKNENLPKKLSSFLKTKKANGHVHIKNEGEDKIKSQLAKVGSLLITTEYLEDLDVHEEIEDWAKLIKTLLTKEL